MLKQKLNSHHIAKCSAKNADQRVSSPDMKQGNDQRRSKGGEMLLRLEDGTTVKASDVEFGSSDEALLYENVLDMGLNAASANAFLRGYDGKLSAEIYALGFREAYQYGEYGVPESELSQEGFLPDLTEVQRHLAYNLGKASAEARVAEQQRKASKSAKSESRKGKLHNTLTPTNETQRASLKALGVVAEALGIDIYTFESSLVNGKRQGANGWYDPSDNSIHIDLFAGIDGKGTMLFTAAHELTHHIRAKLPAKFKAFADFLFEKYGEKGISVSELVAKKQAFLKEKGRITAAMTEAQAYDLAYEEVVADSCESFLADGDAIAKIAELKAKEKRLWQTIKDFITKLVTRIKAAYEGLSPDTVEGRLTSEMLDAAEELKAMWTEMLVEASETENGVAVQPKGVKNSDRDFSYSELVAKNDLQGFVIGKVHQAPLKSNGLIDDNLVFSEVRKGCKTIQTNGGPVFTVDVPDIGRSVEVAKNGVTHSFTRPNDRKKGVPTANALVNARVALKIPDVLKNSIEVNRSQRGNNFDVPYTHVMMGTVALESNQGLLEYYAVRSMIQERENQNPILVEANVLGKLYATNVKKISTPTVQVAQKGVALADGDAYAYSIADFLQDVKWVFDNTFSQDVYQHLGVQRTSDEFSKNLLYSDRYQSADTNSDILSMVEKVESGDFRANEKVDLGTVSDAAAAEIYNITGINVTGFKVAVEARQIHHIIKDHGKNGLTDKSMANPSDIAKIEFALEGYDDISAAGKTQAYTHMVNGKNRTADTVLYEKSIGEKAYYVVQAVPDTKAKTLYIVTAFIGKKGYKKEASQLINAKSPDVTAKTGSADTSIEIISHTDESVKSNFSDRDLDSVSNRTLLADALESTVKDEIERKRLTEYKEAITEIESAQEQLTELRAKIKEMSFATGPRDTKAINALRFEANKLANRISVLDGRLLRLESMGAIKGVLAREKARAYEKAKQEGKEALAAYRRRAEQKQKDLAARYQESRKKGVEGRRKTEMRLKIKGVVNELNQLLKNTKEKHVPIQLQKPVALALAAVNMDTVGAEEPAELQNDFIEKAA